MQPYQAFAACYDALMYDVDYPAWAAYIAGLIERHGAPDRTLLDAACGTGSLTVLLKRAGCIVTGADASSAMLERAAQKARENGLQIPFVWQDLRDMALHRPVGVVNCALDGVNYLTTPEDLRAFLDSARRALKDGGLLLFDVSTPHKLEHIIGQGTFADEVGGAAYIWSNEYDAETRLCAMQLTLFVREAGDTYRRYEEEHIQRAHALDEIKEALKSAGFTLEGAYAFPGSEPAKNDDERWQIAARKGVSAFQEA